MNYSAYTQHDYTQPNYNQHDYTQLNYNQQHFLKTQEPQYQQLFADQKMTKIDSIKVIFTAVSTTIIIFYLIWFIVIEVLSFINVTYLQKYYEYIKKTNGNKLDKEDQDRYNFAQVTLILKYVYYSFPIILFFSVLTDNPYIYIPIGFILVLLTLTITTMSIAVASINIENFDGESGKKYDEYCEKNGIKSINSKQLKQIQIAYLVLTVFLIIFGYRSGSKKKSYHHYNYNLNNN